MTSQASIFGNATCPRDKTTYTKESVPGAYQLSNAPQKFRDCDYDFKQEQAFRLRETISKFRSATGKATFFLSSLDLFLMQYRPKGNSFPYILIEILKSRLISKTQIQTRFLSKRHENIVARCWKRDTLEVSNKISAFIKRQLLKAQHQSMGRHQGRLVLCSSTASRRLKPVLPALQTE